MASLRKVKNRWRIRFYDSRRDPREVTFSLPTSSFTQRQAESILKQWDALYALGQWDPWIRRRPDEDEQAASGTLLRSALDYCEHKRELGRRGQRGGWNATTYRDYLLEFKQFARRTGGQRPVDLLKREDLERYLFDETVARATQGKRRRILKTYLGWLKKHGIPVPDLPRAFVERRTVPEYYTLEEVRAVCRAHLKNIKDRTRKKHVPKSGRNSPMALAWMPDAWLFDFYQGLRLGELMAMRAGGIDLVRCQMIVGGFDFVPKGKDDRMITVTPPARDIVRPYLQDKKRNDYVWPRCQPDRLSKAWKAALRRAVKDGDVSAHKETLDMHDLRDSCCNYWLNEGGVPLERVQELLRHKSIRTTEQFYRSTNVEAQTRAFEAAFRGDRQTSFDTLAGTSLVQYLENRP